MNVTSITSSTDLRALFSPDTPALFQPLEPSYQDLEDLGPYEDTAYENIHLYDPYQYDEDENGQKTKIMACTKPLLLQTTRGIEFTNHWFINHTNELIYDVQKNYYVNLTMFDNKNSHCTSIMYVTESKDKPVDKIHFRKKSKRNTTKEKLKEGQTVYIETGNSIYRKNPNDRKVRPYKIYEADNLRAYTKNKNFRIIQATRAINRGRLFLSKADFEKHVAFEKELIQSCTVAAFERRLKLEKFEHDMLMM